MHAKEDEVGQTDRVVVLLPLLLDALDNVEEKSRKPEGNRLTFILSSTGVRKGNITEKERKFPSWLTGCSSAKRAAVGCVLQGTAGEWAGSG